MLTAKSRRCPQGSGTDDVDARVFKDRGGILRRHRYWFTGSGTPPLPLTEDQYLEGLILQEDEPYWIASYRDRIFWWYRDDCYWTNNDEYDAQDVKALLSHVSVSAGGS